MACVRTLRRAADGDVARLRNRSTPSPVWRAVTAARGLIGRAFFRAIGAVVGVEGWEASASEVEMWGTLEGFASGQEARDEVLAAHEAYRLLAGVESRPKETSPGARALLAWHARRPAELTPAAPEGPAPEAPKAPPKKRRARKVAA